MVMGGQKFCVCEGFWRLWVVGFPHELDAGKNKEVKTEQVKGRGCFAPGKMKRSKNFAQDRIKRGQAEKLEPQPFPSTTEAGNLQGWAGASRKGKRGTNNSIFCVQEMGLQKPQPRAPANASFSPGTREMGKEKLPNKVRGIQSTSGFMGGKWD